MRDARRAAMRLRRGSVGAPTARPPRLMRGDNAACGARRAAVRLRRGRVRAPDGASATLRARPEARSAQAAPAAPTSADSRRRVPARGYASRGAKRAKRCGATRGPRLAWGAGRARRSRVPATRPKRPGPAYGAECARGGGRHPQPGRRAPGPTRPAEARYAPPPRRSEAASPGRRGAAAGVTHPQADSGPRARDAPAVPKAHPGEPGPPGPGRPRRPESPPGQGYFPYLGPSSVGSRASR